MRTGDKNSATKLGTTASLFRGDNEGSIAKPWSRPEAYLREGQTNIKRTS